MHRPLGTSLSTIPPVIPEPHFQYMGASQPLDYTSTQRTVPASTMPGPAHATRASTSTSALFASSRKDAPTILQGHGITSSYKQSDHSDEGRLSTSHILEEE